MVGNRTLWSKIWIAINAISTVWAQRNGFYSYEGMWNSTYSSAGSAYDFMAAAVCWFDCCPLSSNIVQTLQEKLPYYVQSQELALEAIINAAASWEFKLRSGFPEPCVMAFTGPSGVGKSETAYRFAESVLSKQGYYEAGSRRKSPSGLLNLKGGDYSLPAATQMPSNQDATSGNINSPFHNSIVEMRGKIRSIIFSHLKKCSGNAVIIFEEVQKVVPGVLEVLIPMLHERGSVTDTTNNVELSTSHCVFIFISDIADDKMIKLLMTYGNRSAIPHSVLRYEVKLALDQQWQRLNFGRVVNEVVPFLPLEPIHMKDILIMKLKQASDENQNMFWSHLVVDDNVVGYLVGKDFITYSKHTAISKTNLSQQQNMNNTQSSVAGGSGGNSIITADFGARSLINAGPLHDIHSLLFLVMQPWRPKLVLHVGIADRHTSSSPFASLNSAHLQWTSAIKPNQIYLQWCDPSVLKTNNNEKADQPPPEDSCDYYSSSNHDENKTYCTQQQQQQQQQQSDQRKSFKLIKKKLPSINEKVAFSDACETIWFGYLQR